MRPGTGKSWRPGSRSTRKLLEDFKAQVRGEGITIDEAMFAEDIDFVRAMLHYEIDLALFSVEEAKRNLLAKDPQAQYALGLFGETAELLELR